MNDELLIKTQRKLEQNGFDVYICETPTDARALFISDILPRLALKSASYGDSETLKATGILEVIKSHREIDFIETFDVSQSREERIHARRNALLVDLFLAGSNAVTESGQLINLDMTGNRITGITFGPKNVLLTIGKNKIVKNIDEGIRRVKEICAPKNARRHPDFNTPCQTTGYCLNCSSDQRICNVWSIMEKCYPKKRIKIILINADLGL